MLINVKNSQKQMLKIEIGEEETIFDLKKKIEDLCGFGYCIAFQKIIYAAKILENEKTIGSYELSEKKPVMVTQSSIPLETFINQPNVFRAYVERIQKTIEEITDLYFSLVLKSSKVSYMNSHPNCSIGEVFMTLNSNILFHQVIDLVYTNPERLAEVLESTSEIDPEVVDIVANNQDAVIDILNGEIILADGKLNMAEFQLPETRNPEELLAFFISAPQFHQLKKLIKSNPAALPYALNMICRTNPDVFALIVENRNKFVEMMGSSGRTVANVANRNNRRCIF